MKKVISALMVVALLFGAVATLAACGKSGVNLSEYTVIYGDGSGYFKDIAKSVAADIKTLTGKKVESDAVKQGDKWQKNDNKEILIGNTDRPESLKALEKLKGYSYSITTDGDKIVIVGTTNMLTCLAVQKFGELYLNGSADATSLTVKKFVAKDVPMTELDAEYALVYSQKLDSTVNTTQQNYIDKSNIYGVDYSVIAAYTLREEIAGRLGVNASQMKLAKDDLPIKKEIVLGATDREISKTALQELDVYEYAVMASGGAVAVAAHSDNYLKKALELFSGIMADSTVKEGEVTKLMLPTEFTAVRSDPSEWVIDFPRPTGENVALSGALDVYDGSMLFLYTGNGVNADSFKAYCASLEAAGYTKYMENEIEESLFRTYTNSEKRQTLTVTYAKYKHAQSQRVAEYAPCIRIISAVTGKVKLLPASMLQPNYKGYTKKIDSRITSVALNWMPFDYERTSDNETDDRSEGTIGAERGYGNSYVVTLEDGSFFVMDTGFSNTVDVSNFYNLLKELHEEASGAEVSATNSIRIAAWFLTHDHGDHYGTFMKFLQMDEVRSGGVKIEKLIANFTSNEVCYNVVSPGNAMRNSALSAIQRVDSTAEYIKVHTGQKFYIANAEFEVLCTHEDLYPNRTDRFNDTSTVIRMTMVHTDGQGNVSEGSETTVLWLGDAENMESRVMRTMYGSYLQSEMVQMAHHAGWGCELKFYELVAPKTVLIPQSRAYYAQNNYLRDNEIRGWGVTYQLTHNVASVEYIVLEDLYHTTFTVGAAGVNYNFEANDGVIGGNTGIYSLLDGDGSMFAKMAWSDTVVIYPDQTNQHTDAMFDRYFDQPALIKKNKN